MAEQARRGSAGGQCRTCEVGRASCSLRVEASQEAGYLRREPWREAGDKNLRSSA